MAVHSLESRGEQAEFLDEENLVIDHNQIPHVEHMSGENENELEKAMRVHPVPSKTFISPIQRVSEQSFRK